MAKWDVRQTPSCSLLGFNSVWFCFLLVYHWFWFCLVSFLNGEQWNRAQNVFQTNSFPCNHFPWGMKTLPEHNKGYKDLKYLLVVAEAPISSYRSRASACKELTVRATDCPSPGGVSPSELMLMVQLQHHKEHLLASGICLLVPLRWLLCSKATLKRAAASGHRL